MWGSNMRQREREMWKIIFIMVSLGKNEQDRVIG